MNALKDLMRHHDKFLEITKKLLEKTTQEKANWQKDNQFGGFMLQFDDFSLKLYTSRDLGGDDYYNISIFDSKGQEIDREQTSSGELYLQLSNLYKAVSKHILKADQILTKLQNELDSDNEIGKPRKNNTEPL